MNNNHKKSKKKRFFYSKYFCFFLRVSKISSFSNIHSSKRPSSSLKLLNTSDDNLHRERNTLVVLGCLAEKLG